MTVADLILLTIAISCGSILFQGLRSSGGAKGLWLMISGGILTYIVFGMWLNWPRIMPIATSLWMLFLVVPLVMMGGIQRLVSQGQYRLAFGLAQGLSVLHPGDGWRTYPQLLRALHWAQQGHTKQAVQTLAKYKHHRSPMAWVAIALLYRIRNDWDGYLTWTLELSTYPPGTSQHGWKQHPTLVIYYLRALAETEQFTEFFQQVESYWALFDGDRSNASLLQLFALAFGGQVLALKEFLHCAESPVRGEARRYWLAIATMTAGQSERAKDQLKHLLASTSDMALRQSVEYRLKHPLPATAHYLDQDLRQRLLASGVRHTTHPNYDFTFARMSLFPMTFVLIATNLFVFGLQLAQGSSTNLDILYGLGALWPPAVWMGETWRLVTANFLHFGITHLGMNMLGLWILGPFVERALGKLAYFIVYMGSGVGAMVCIAYLPKLLARQPEFTVGASGAVMGLVGAIACITLWGWLVEKVAIAAKRFRLVLFMIAVQTVFDFSVENISITGHLSGLILGFFLSLLMILTVGLRRQIA